MHWFAIGRAAAGTAALREKAAEGRRHVAPESDEGGSPGRKAFAGGVRIVRSVVECASPLALSFVLDGLPRRRVAPKSDEGGDFGVWLDEDPRLFHCCDNAERRLCASDLTHSDPRTATTRFPLSLSNDTSAASPVSGSASPASNSFTWSII
jgi:hypothetical protein